MLETVGPKHESKNRAWGHRVAEAPQKANAIRPGPGSQMGDLNLKSYSIVFCSDAVACHYTPLKPYYIMSCSAKPYHCTSCQVKQRRAAHLERIFYAAVQYLVTHAMSRQVSLAMSGHVSTRNVLSGMLCDVLPCTVMSHRVWRCWAKPCG